MPNHTMNKGSTPSSGMDRSAWTIGSNAVSATRLSPVTMASSTAMATPRLRPIAHRSAETSSDPCSVPYVGEEVTTRLYAVCAMVAGETSLLGGSTPVLLSSCHRPTKTIRLTSRANCRGRRGAATESVRPRSGHRPGIRSGT